jgi:hypothetical protein
MRRRRMAIATLTAALLGVIVLIAGLLVFVSVAPRAITQTTTSVATQTATAFSTQTTTTFIQTTEYITPHTQTTTSVQSLSTTTTTTETQSSECAEVAGGGGYVLPDPTERWFIAGVDYTGPWVATMTVYNGGSPLYSACYAGDNTGGGALFWYQSQNLTNSSTVRIIATKLDGSMAVLQVACNGVVNGTSVPYGSIELTAPVNGPANFNSTTS